MAYQINFTDPSSGTITLDAGATNGPVPGTALKGNERTDIRLFGENAFDWGEGVNENMLNLLENFACPEKSANVPSGQPELGGGMGINNPVRGQLWYNTTDNELYSFNGTQWVQASGAGPTVKDVQNGSALMYLATGEGVSNAYNLPTTLITDNTYTPTAFTSVLNDSLGGFSLSTPEYWTVPSGVSWVKITAQASLRTYGAHDYPNAPLIYTVGVYKEGLNQYHNFVAMDSAQYPAGLTEDGDPWEFGLVLNTSTPWMPVQAGDRFSTTVLIVSLGRQTCFDYDGLECRQTKYSNVGNWMLVEHR